MQVTMVPSLDDLVAHPECVRELPVEVATQTLIRLFVVYPLLVARVMQGPSAEPVPRENKKYLTVQQVAERLAVPDGRVYELCRQGKLPTVRIGKYVRISEVELTGWLARRRACGSLDTGIYSAYSRRRERQGAATHTETPRPNASRIGSQAGRRPQQRGPMGAERDGHAGAGSPAAPTAAS